VGIGVRCVQSEALGGAVEYAKVTTFAYLFVDFNIAFGWHLDLL
jgi:hypothetical protein